MTAVTAVTEIREHARRIKALPAEHDGVWYRSRTEARWAVFFTYLYRHGLDSVFDYEPQGFTTDGTSYLPDFLLASQSLIAEVKPDLDTDPDGVAKWRALIEARGKERGVLLTSMGSGARQFLLIGPSGDGGPPWECDTATWLVCPGGYHLDIHSYPPVGCERCRITAEEYWYDDKRVGEAFSYARSYRFGQVRRG